MAEVMVFLSAVQATTQLVEQAFRILGRIRKAHERQKGLVDVLTRHETELRDVKAIIGVIEDEDDLQIPSVVAELVKLREIQTRLAKVLAILDPKTKSKINQFAHQFVQGSSDEKKLGAIMDEVVHVKISFLLHIQMANVTFAGNVEKGLVANAIAIRRIDETLRDHLKTCEGLQIAQLLKGRPLSEDGTVPLTLEELHSLSIKDDNDSSGDETLVDDGKLPSRRLSVRTERIITENTTRFAALQINGPVGPDDPWKDIDRLVIKNNKADEYALQVNYGTTFEFATFLMDRQKEMLASAPQLKRYDSAYQE